MNASFTDAIARQLADLPTVPVPDLGEPGYGRDLDCVQDCSDDFKEIGPDTPRIIVQAQARRFQTPRGALLDDLDYGLDLRGRVNVGTTTRELRTLQSQAVGEALKDERVESVSLQLTYAENVLRLVSVTTPHDPRLEPFQSVMTVTQAAVTIAG